MYEITCPNCKGDHLRRVKRGSLFKLLTLNLPFKKYSCFNCGKKYYFYKAPIPT